MLVTGNGNGALRIFSVKQGQALIEISAHSRSISSLDVAPESGLVSIGLDFFTKLAYLLNCIFTLLNFIIYNYLYHLSQVLSVSEDSTVCVWKITNGKTPQVRS